MISFITFIKELHHNHTIFFVIIILSLIIKFSLFLKLLLQSVHSKFTPKPLIYLSCVLLTGIIVDLSWIGWFFQKLFLAPHQYMPVIFLTRISWAFSMLQYQSLALFIESMIEKKYNVSKLQKIFLTINLLIIGFFTCSAFKTNNLNQQLSFYAVILSQLVSALYILFIMMPCTIILTIKKMRMLNLPKILVRQIKIILQLLIFPYLFSDLFQILFDQSLNKYVMSCLSSLLITYAIVYCSKKIIGLRFLNFKPHVQAPSKKFNFITDFKNILSKLSHINSPHELGHITEFFFKEALKIPSSAIHFTLRKKDLFEDYEQKADFTEVQSTLEEFISNLHQDSTLFHYIRQTKVIITDEIAFSNFYDETATDKDLLTFLNKIKADMFIPIFNHHHIIAYIIIDRGARKDLYSNFERDEITIFVSYLSNCIYLLERKNMIQLIQEEKALSDELFNKHQEMNQFRESLRTFFYDHTQTQIGIIFYKKDRLLFANQASKEFVKEYDEFLLQKIRTCAKQTADYKTIQTYITRNSAGSSVVINSIPSFDQDTILITISYPEIADIIKQQIDLLDNPLDWHYLLYLQSTQAGQLINEFIPCNSPKLLNVKINLLKHSLQKKALLVQAHYDDLLTFVDIVHAISLREVLYTLKLSPGEHTQEIGFKLFGSSLYTEKPLLEKLHNNGTLYIKDIHLLDRTAQDYLVEYLKFGFFHNYKGDKTITSNVRIICSTNQNLSSLVQENKFSKDLYNELKQSTVFIPSVAGLSQQEFNELADSITEQIIKSHTVKNLFLLNSNEKKRLFLIGIQNIKELRYKIEQLLLHKSKKNHLSYQQSQENQSQDILLQKAAQLGKKALRDPELLKSLMMIFKNQNKIATFLGVNRSTVNRHYKELNL